MSTYVVTPLGFYPVIPSVGYYATTLNFVGFEIFSLIGMVGEITDRSDLLEPGVILSKISIA